LQLMKASWRDTDQENPPLGAAAAGDKPFIGPDPSTHPGHKRPANYSDCTKTGLTGTRLAR